MKTNLGKSVTFPVKYTKCLVLLYKGLTLTDVVIRLMGKCTSLGAPAQAFACLHMYLHHPHVCLGCDQLRRTDRPFAVADRLNPSVVGGDPSFPHQGLGQEGSKTNGENWEPRISTHEPS